MPAPPDAPTRILVLLLLAGCGAGADLTQPFGAVQVTTTTVNGAGGESYQVVVEGRSPVEVTENDTVVVADLEPGEREVNLTGVGPGCVVEGANPRPVSVVEGIQAQVGFQIVCVTEAPTGSLEVSVTTTGDPQDTTGYTVQVDPDASQPLELGGTVTVAGLAEGDHLVRLADVADNCSVRSENPRSVSIVAGETARTAFEVTCRGPLTGRIAYVSDREGDGYDILVRNADGTGTVNLTHTPSERDRSPAWSPDGTTLCFHRDDTFSDDAVYLVDVATARRSALHTGFPGVFGCRWSPDGTRILFVSVGGTRQRLGAVGAGGANPRAIATFDFFSGYDWSPDGRRVTFVASDFSDVDDDFPDLFVANADGTGPANLTGNVDRNISEAHWSPDGRWIAFVAYVPDGTGQNIYLIDPVTREEVDLTKNPSIYRTLAWSPDGSRLAFVRDRSPDFEVSIDDIYTIQPDGTGLVNLTNSPENYFDLSWSPDGQRLLFTYGFFAIGMINADGSGRRKLTADDASDFEPAWSP